MTKLVGILNITPDSFSDGGLYVGPEAALAHADELFRNGAALVDVGAESTRPGAEVLTPDEEQARLALVLPELLKRYPGQIMLDSYHPETVRWAAEYGRFIVNDVTGLTNPRMLEAILDVLPQAVVISQLPANSPQIAHTQPRIRDLSYVRDDLLRKAQQLIAAGYNQERIILDPGIGFGKTPELNKELLTFSAHLKADFQTMIGYSRKRFLGESRLELEPNIEAARVAIAAGATYLRVHDVAGHVRELGDALD